MTTQRPGSNSLFWYFLATNARMAHMMRALLCVLCLAWCAPSALARPTKGAKGAKARVLGTHQKSKRANKALTRKLQRWLSTKPQRKQRRLAQAGKGKNDDDVPPEIIPVAPLPKVFRRVRISSSPPGVPLTIKDGARTFPCVPANTTPCTFEVTGEGKVNLSIVIRYQGRTLNYFRSVEGSSITVDVWLLNIPKAGTSGTISRQRRLPPKKKKPKSSGALKWALVAVSVAVVGISAGLIGYALVTQDHLKVRLVNN